MQARYLLRSRMSKEIMYVKNVALNVVFFYFFSLALENICINRKLCETLIYDKIIL